MTELTGFQLVIATFTDEATAPAAVTRLLAPDLSLKHHSTIRPAN